jgi:hypothetical protein
VCGLFQHWPGPARAQPSIHSCGLDTRYTSYGPLRSRGDLVTIFDSRGREIPATAVKLGTPVRVVYAQGGWHAHGRYIVRGRLDASRRGHEIGASFLTCVNSNRAKLQPSLTPGKCGASVSFSGANRGKFCGDELRIAGANLWPSRVGGRFGFMIVTVRSGRFEFRKRRQHFIPHRHNRKRFPSPRKRV